MAATLYIIVSREVHGRVVMTIASMASTRHFTRQSAAIFATMPNHAQHCSTLKAISSPHYDAGDCARDHYTQ